MPDKIEITVKVNGENVPLTTLSDETISKIKEQEIEVTDKNDPVFSMTKGRLIIKLTPEVLSTLRSILNQIDNELSFVKEGSFMSLEPRGTIGTYNLGNTWKKASIFYTSGPPAKALFPND